MSRTLRDPEATPPTPLLAGVTEADPASSPPHPTAGLRPRPAQKAGPPLRGLLRPPSGAVLQPGGQRSPLSSAPLVGVSRASTAIPGAPGPPSPGHGAEPARGPARGHLGWTQRGACAQLHALDPGPRGLGEPPKPFWGSLYPTVLWVLGGRGFFSDFTRVLPALPLTCSESEHPLYTKHCGHLADPMPALSHSGIDC